MKMIKFYIIFLLCNINLGSLAQNIYHIDSLYPVHPLDGYLMILEDSMHHISLNQIATDTTLHFLPLDSYHRPLNAGSTYWAILKVSSIRTLQNWYLCLENENHFMGGWGRGNGKVDVFAYQNQQRIWHKRTGTEYPKRNRDIKPLWNQNRISFDIHAGDTAVIYIKIQGNGFGFPPHFNLVLRSPSYQHHDPLFNKFTFVNKFLFGILFITFLYHLLLFLHLRHGIHLWFSIWLFFSLITIAINIDVGLINEYLIGNFPTWQLPLWVMTANSVWFTFWFFGRVFVGTKNKYPIFDKFILVLTTLILIETIFYLITSTLPISGNNTENLNHIFRICFNIAGLVLAFILAFKKDRLARYFGVGAILAHIAPLAGALWVAGFIHLSFDPFVWGVLLQVIAYSFGLAYRQRLKDDAFKKSQLDLLHAERGSMELQRKIDLDELKAKFFANISHEFRTPLSLIMGPLKQAKKSNSADITINQKTYAIIGRNTKRLQGLIDQLLDLSKIESGQIDVELSKGGLIRFIKSIASDFENMALQRNIDYNINSGQETDYVYFDKDKLQKIIHNLLSNAFKYTPEGRSVNLTVDLIQDYLILTIEDTGPGIPENQMEKIFDRFYRIESNESKGSGIGLALTKELVDLLNGSIIVKSQLGKGTTFKVTIPTDIELLPHSRTRLHQNQETTHTSLTKYHEEDRQDIPTVLVVEDNEDLRSYIADILSPDYQVILAEDGLSGEHMAIEHIPNIIISDVMMPKRNGYDLCKRLKSNVITSHIPIILLTAKAGQENKMSGLTYGADVYMTKPFEADELLIRTSNFIESRNKIWNQFKSIGGSLAQELSISSIDNQFFQKIQSEIQNNLSNEQFSVEDLAKAVGFSRSQLHRKLKALVNKSASQLIRETRLHRAKSILEKKSMRVSEVAYSVGYSNLSYFTKSFKESFGYLPSDLK